MADPLFYFFILERRWKQKSTPAPRERAWTTNTHALHTHAQPLALSPDTCQESLRGLPGIGRLLYGAASRLERGTSTCLQCKGSGTVDCKDCGGSGLTTSPRAAGTGLLRKVLGKLKSVVGKGVPGGSAMGDAAFILSNRCRRCHGLGRMTCGACGGLGVRATLRRPGDARP